MTITHLPLTMHQLVFEAEVQTPIEFGPQVGAQLRGALWEALRDVVFCDDKLAGTPEHSLYCPLCRLIMMESQTSPRGANPPRPFAIRPPLDFDDHLRLRLVTGETLRFGVNLYGDAEQLFPYVCQAIYKIGQIGVGYGRGQYVLRRALACNPLTGQQQDIFSDGRLRGLPGVPITHEQIAATVQTLPKDRITLKWLTPCELTEQQRPARIPYAHILLARLAERAQLLELHYTPEPREHSQWRSLHLHLQDVARSISITKDSTRWVHVMSGSRRAQGLKPISGVIGEVQYNGDLSELLYWLIWGSALHVGKNVVKGNGWYEIVTLEQ
ncbi:MAG: CRISPR system precrRNA processing endoribonuclease RAMP protein Cas6 [Chloroflexi bacterium]|nr:CRISPR system precrRNA processing endoribonuclease RAMP protein Cas6 [Chloroflexota bacterium]